MAKLSVWGRRDGALVVRSPLANLDTVVVRPGLVGVVAVLFGSTAFDSFKDSSVWLRFTQAAPRRGLPARQPRACWASAPGVGLIFAVGRMATGVGPGQSRWQLPDLFAHSVVPIIVGYIVAHYLSYLVEVGQQTVILMSDPMSNGSDLLGTGDCAVNYWLSYHPTFLATTKVARGGDGSRAGRHRRPRPRRQAAAGPAPGDRPAAAAGGDGGFTVGGLYLLFAA